MIIVNKGAVAREDMKRDIAPLLARKELQKEYQWRDNVLSGKTADSMTLEGTASFRPLDRIQDPNAMRKQRDDYKRNYERTAPITLSALQQNELWKKAKVLKDKITIGMVSKHDLHPVSQRLISNNGIAKLAVVADYDKLRDTKAIERNQAWYKRNEKDLQELKRILRMLEPDNPDIANLERFRPN